MKKPNWNIPTEDELIADFEPDASEDLAPKTTKEKLSVTFNPYDIENAKKMYTSGIVLSIVAIIFMIFSICYTVNLKKAYSQNIPNQSLNLKPAYGNNFETMDNAVNSDDAQENTEQNAVPQDNSQMGQVAQPSDMQNQMGQEQTYPQEQNMQTYPQGQVQQVPDQMQIPQQTGQNY